MLNNLLTYQIRVYGMLLCLIYSPLPATAKVSIEGIMIPSKVVVESQTLTLNGAGFRSVLFMDIYLASLYLPQPSTKADFIIQTSRPAELRMDFLHGGAGHNMLAKGWRKGFEHNQTAESMRTLEGRLQEFSNLFGDVQKGEVFMFEFLSNGDTQIRFDSHIQGIIHGADFQQALLAIWLGKHPVGGELKKELLDYKWKKERMK